MNLWTMIICMILRISSDNIEAIEKDAKVKSWVKSLLSDTDVVNELNDVVAQYD